MRKKLNREFSKNDQSLLLDLQVFKSCMKTNLDRSHIDHSNSKLTISPNHIEIKKLHVSNNLEQVSNINARLTNQYKFKYQTVFSAIIDKKDEDD